MLHRLDNRLGHWSLLLVVWAMVCLPNLGAPSLWDIDEPNNGQCAREMYESRNWLVPTFNYELRDDKPVLLYWLQMTAFHLFGINEFSTRLPSAVAMLLTLLTTYELGRRLFGSRVGLLAGLILASAIAFNGAGHFANPDALLTLFTLLTLACFWHDYSTPGLFRYIGGGAAMGLAVLAKGPVGFVLPVAITVLFLLWQRRLRFLLDPQHMLGSLTVLVVAAPWYIWVAVETKGQWLLRFWEKHNFFRYRVAMEGHGGPFYSYLVILVAGLAPWSVFLGLAFWHALRRRGEDKRATGPNELQPLAGDKQEACPGGPGRHIPGEVRFLLCWIAVFLVFFSASATKLPNYILPLYPAVALLTAYFLDDWRRGLVQPPAWVLHVTMGLLVIMGLGVAAGILIVAGVGQLPIMRNRFFPGLEWLALVGLELALAGVAGSWLIRRQQRGAALAVLSVASVLFVASLASVGAPVISRFHAPRQLARLLPEDQLEHEVRIAAYRYFQPSLVFYFQRRVDRLEKPENVTEFLNSPLPSYLILKMRDWESLKGSLTAGRPLGHHHDFYANDDLMVIANPAAQAN